MEDAAADAPLADAGIDAPPPMMMRFVIDDPADMRDTWLWSENPATPYGGDVQGSVDDEANESSLFWFDLSQIPANATVMSATFRIRSDDTDDNGTVNAFVMLQSWVELEATFLTRAGTQTWATPGARPPSRATTMIGSFAPTTTQTYFNVALAPAAVQPWIANPATNFGFILVRGTANDHLHFHMKESSFPPRLTVDVLVPQ